jgi:hypothetical protein
MSLAPVLELVSSPIAMTYYLMHIFGLSAVLQRGGNVRWRASHVLSNRASAQGWQRA